MLSQALFTSNLANVEIYFMHATLGGQSIDVQLYS